MELVIAKAIVILTMFTVTFSLTLLPLKLVSVVKRTLDPQRRRNYKRTISLLNCFGGGVFLGACLLDLFPEVRDELSKAFDRLEIITSFPVSEFIMVFGFFLAFILEQIVLAFKESGRKAAEREPLIGGEGRHRSYRTNVEDAEEVAVVPPSPIEIRFDPRSLHSDFETYSTLRCVVLLVALSLHSVFEGFAIGLQDSIDSLVQILAAVVIHKSIIAFSLGLNLVQSTSNLKTLVIMSLLFSVMTPIGIASGIGVLRLSHSVSLLSGVLQGIACGTFLFVTFFEVLPHEMNGQYDRLPKVLATLVGFIVVCGALFLDPSVERPSCYRGAEPANRP